MSDKKRKYEANVHLIQDAVIIPHQAHAIDLTDCQPIGYLSGMKPENEDGFSRDTILRLIATLKEK